ncbi:DUF6998 domain-containing protein [Sphingomonas qomolangmaensis]|uniref:DUF6998 domain-containing protein n=1 Tax=Sphingomonas qomolangmaensis TaxID=2918765 RepID=A0ABY5L905_9SPHN|nr:hypothetical protein [Sphingomonas qomolangmaensis]UUL82553.1 hypothetical protein NMP03_15505 [Sphingomonas qomolangmaensis]
MKRDEDSSAARTDQSVGTIRLPEAVRTLVTAHRALVLSYAATDLRFTLDGRLVGDIGEATAASAFGLGLCRKRMPGVDALTRDGRTVQIKASGIGKGPAFSPGEGCADHLIFLMFDFERAEARVLYNGPEAPVRAELPLKFTGTKRVSVPLVLTLDAAVDELDRLKRVC